MATFHWTAEAGATAGDETTVTSFNGGTDGPTSVSSVSGGTRVFDNAQAAHGSWSLRLATGATSGTSNAVWGSTRIPDPAVAYFGFYIRFSEMLSNRSIARVRAGATQVLRVHRTADGRLELRNSGNTVVATGTVSMSADTWYRVEILADPGNTSTCTLRLYLGDAAVGSWLDEVAATSDFSSAATVNELTVGNIAAGANIPDYWVDDVRFSDAGWLGPVGGTDAAPTPGAVVASATVPAGAVAADAAPVPAVVLGAVALPSTGVSVGAVTQPGMVAAQTALPSPTARGSAGVAPSAVAAVAAVSAASPSGQASASPATAAGTGSVPAAAVRVGASITAVPTATTAAVPTPAVLAGTGASVAPPAVTASTAVGGVALSTGALLPAATVAAAVGTPAAAVTITGGYIPRPSTGTVQRPSTGMVTRPDTGLILQP